MSDELSNLFIKPHKRSLAVSPTDLRRATVVLGAFAAEDQDDEIVAAVLKEAHEAGELVRVCLALSSLTVALLDTDKRALRRLCAVLSMKFAAMENRA